MGVDHLWVKFEIHKIPLKNGMMRALTLNDAQGGNGLVPFMRL